MKIIVITENPWLKELISQAFEEVIFSSLENAEVIIDEKDDKFIVKNIASNKEFNFLKPIDIKELFSTLMLIEKEFKQIIITFANYKFYPELRICITGEKAVEVTQKEAEIIEFLAKNKGYIEKNILLEKIWGYSDEVVTKTLETHIYKIKNKLGDDVISNQESKYKLVR